MTRQFNLIKSNLTSSLIMSNSLQRMMDSVRLDQSKMQVVIQEFSELKSNISDNHLEISQLKIMIQESSVEDMKRLNQLQSNITSSLLSRMALMQNQLDSSSVEQRNVQSIANSAAEKALSNQKDLSTLSDWIHQILYLDPSNSHVELRLPGSSTSFSMSKSGALLASYMKRPEGGFIGFYIGTWIDLAGNVIKSQNLPLPG